MPQQKRKTCRVLRVGVFGDEKSFLPLISSSLTTQNCQVIPVDSTLAPTSLRELHLDLCIIDLAEPATSAHIFMRRLPGVLPIIAVIEDAGREFEFAEIFDVLALPLDVNRFHEDIEYLRAAAHPAETNSIPPTDSEIEQFSEYISQKCGLNFDRRNRKCLERGILRRMKVVLAASGSAYLTYLERFQESRQELKKLIALLTIGETSFFRFDPHFSALVEQVIPDLINKNQKTRSLRIWSAGCSTGEEAYSLAITLRHYFPQLANWEITILGTDINKLSLTAARAGTYRERTLRHISPEILTEYFDFCNPGWKIAEHLRSLVRFSFLNLQSETYPNPKDGTTECDLIFCRNVMIYFRPETVRAVVSRLRRALRPGGYLFLGHAETLGSGLLDFIRCQHHGGIFYQAEAVSGADNFVPASRQPLEKSRKQEITLFEKINENPMLSGVVESRKEENSGIISSDKVNNKTVSQKRPLGVTLPTTDGLQLLEQGFLLADQGRLDDALRLCEQALHADDLSPRGHFLRGLIHDQQGKSQAASEDFQRAILLDIKTVMAHYHLAHVFRRLGRKSDALRSLQTTMRLLTKMGASEPIPDARDWTVPGLLSRCETELKQMQR